MPSQYARYNLPPPGLPYWNPPSGEIVPSVPAWNPEDYGSVQRQMMIQRARREMESPWWAGIKTAASQWPEAWADIAYDAFGNPNVTPTPVAPVQRQMTSPGSPSWRDEVGPMADGRGQQAQPARQPEQSLQLQRLLSEAGYWDSIGRPDLARGIRQRAQMIARAQSEMESPFWAGLKAGVADFLNPMQTIEFGNRPQVPYMAAGPGGEMDLPRDVPPRGQALPFTSSPESMGTMPYMGMRPQGEPLAYSGMPLGSVQESAMPGWVPGWRSIGRGRFETSPGQFREYDPSTGFDTYRPTPIEAGRGQTFAPTQEQLDTSLRLRRHRAAAERRKREDQDYFTRASSWLESQGLPPVRREKIRQAMSWYSRRRGRKSEGYTAPYMSSGAQPEGGAPPRQANPEWHGVGGDFVAQRKRWNI
jgi:hypothetical protein